MNRINISALNFKPSVEKEAGYMRARHSAAPDLAWYEEQKANRPSHLAHWEWIPPSPGLGLEIGGGSCLITYLLRSSGWRMVCSDIFDNQAHASMGVEIFPKENIPYPNEHFDLAVCANVLHHGDLDATGIEIWRVLKPFGVFISFQEPAISESDNEQEYLLKHCKECIDGGVDEHRPTLKKYASALKKFMDVRFFYCNSGPIPNNRHHLEVGGGCSIIAIK